MQTCHSLKQNKILTTVTCSFTLFDCILKLCVKHYFESVIPAMFRRKAAINFRILHPAYWTLELSFGCFLGASCCQSIHEKALGELPNVTISPGRSAVVRDAQWDWSQGTTKSKVQVVEVVHCFRCIASMFNKKYRTGWWFQTFFIFTPTWGNHLIWLIFFKWVETTT